MLIHHKYFERKWVTRYLHYSQTKQAETFPQKAAVAARDMVVDGSSPKVRSNTFRYGMLLTRQFPFG